MSESPDPLAPPEPVAPDIPDVGPSPDVPVGPPDVGPSPEAPGDLPFSFRARRGASGPVPVASAMAIRTMTSDPARLATVEGTARELAPLLSWSSAAPQ